MKKNRNTIIFFLLMLNVVILFPVNSSGQVMDNFEETAVHFIDAYFIKRDNVNKMSRFPQCQSPELENYINSRIDIESTAKLTANIVKQNYQLSVTLTKKENVDSLEILTYGVRRNFTYSDMNVPTVVSDEVVIVGQQGIIIDALFPYDPIEKELRGSIDRAHLQEKACIESLDISTIKQKAEIYKERLLKSLNASPLNDGSEFISNIETTLYPISASKSVNWAKSNYNKFTPLSSSLVVPYYDFSKISGNFDCTNFISHALLAGGAKLNNNGNASTGWWYSSLTSRSNSWSSVDYLYSYLTSVHSKGPVAVSTQYKIFDERNGYPFSVGDIVQFGSPWIHSTMIMGFYNYTPTSPYRYGALVIGRTSPTQYNYNLKVEDSNYVDKRVLVMKGTY